MDLSEATAAKIDVTTCDAEPIHIPGSIQPYGVLLALHPVSHVVEQVAGDTPGLLGVALEDVLGQPAAKLLGAEQLQGLISSITHQEPTDRSLPIFHALVVPGGRQLSAFAYDSDGIPVIELEPTGSKDASRVVALLQSMQRAIISTNISSELCQRVAVNIRAATGFDRVMVYRFLPDGSGVVEAEAREPEMEAFLGLHYPASDIPQQARAMYLRRWLRLIPDARYTAAPLVPLLNPSRGKPLGMEQSLLRSVSPIHLEYLANMGVAASMSVSIVLNGQLWGLIACHHGGVMHVAPDVRMACELFAELFSLRLASDCFQQSIEDRRAAGSIVDRLIRGLVGEPDLGRGLTALDPNLLDLLPAPGATLWFAGRAASIGQTPTPAQIAGIIGWLDAQQDQLIITDRLPALHPPAAEFADVASGLLAVSLSKERGTYVLWYLPEFAHSISWAGNPNKAVTTGPHGTRLTPRGSFELWKEGVFHRSRPWLPAEIEAATALRMVLLDVVLRQMAKAAAEREKASRQQDLLMAELDHRVKNMLATIQALARQSLAGETTLEGFQQSFQGRLQAMSRAHNVLTRSRWESVDLRSLIAEELEPYQDGVRSQVVLRADTEVALRPKAALAVCLAIHELATNAGKYGALSLPGGHLDVQWQLTPGPQRELKLTWRESGGPPVSKPARSGFGTKLITTSLAYEIDGAVDMKFPVEGVICNITIPAEALVLPDHVPTPATPAQADLPARSGVEGARVLLVEDNAMIAAEVVEALDAMGAVVVGPVGRLAAALRLIETEPVDVALLDVDLNGTKVWPLAEQLASRSVPFCFASGYDPSLVVPPKLRDRQTLNKPYTLRKLEAMLNQLLGR
jgi:two-component system, chemotaxis family, sensor kinase Cph1